MLNNETQRFRSFTVGALALAVVTMVLFGGVSAVLAAQASAPEVVTLVEEDDDPEQADPVPGRIGRGFSFGRGLPFGRGKRALGEGAIDMPALLAKELGVSVETLEAAQQAAREVAQAQALEEGLITQEQVDQMQARKALSEYLDHEALLEEAFAMTPAEVREAVQSGDLDAEIVREELAAVREAALAQAVQDGVITQEQAEALANGGLMALGMGGKFGSRGCGEGEFPEGFDGSMMPRGGRRGFAPNADGDTDP
jgi:hypothetical protein